MHKISDDCGSHATKKASAVFGSVVCRVSLQPLLFVANYVSHNCQGRARTRELWVGWKEDISHTTMTKLKYVVVI